MAAVKKVEQKTIRLIEETKAIAALEILLSENEFIHFGNNDFQFLLTDKSNHLRRSFQRVYEDECEVILYGILLWSTYIFTEARKYSVAEIYSKYTECISLIDNQPMKVIDPGFTYLAHWLSSRHRKDFAIDTLDAKDNTIWLFKGLRYEVKRVYSDEEARLLILEDFDKERQKFERLKTKFDEVPTHETTYARPRIPEKVRIEVWRRDGGKCARCGSREKLEYDHIVPISRGGSNTARNIELLCETCNRSKSNNIA